MTARQLGALLNLANAARWAVEREFHQEVGKRVANGCGSDLATGLVVDSPVGRARTDARELAAAVREAHLAALAAEADS